MTNFCNCLLQLVCWKPVSDNAVGFSPKVFVNWASISMSACTIMSMVSSEHVKNLYQMLGFQPNCSWSSPVTQYLGISTFAGFEVDVFV
jgi:hypothetical protein